jgi:hypothetical protein
LYGRLQRAFRDEKDDLESALDKVDSAVSSVAMSCGYNLGGVAKTQAATPQDFKARLCVIYSRYKGLLQMQTLMEMCKKSMSEEECRKCLQGK